MDNDYRIVLEEIILFCKQQKDNESISLTYLSSKSSLKPDYIERAVSFLEKEGYITVTHPNPKVTMLRPSKKGVVKVKGGVEAGNAKKPGKILLSVGKIIGASLIVTIFGFLLSWLGLTNLGIEPFWSYSAPFRFYDQWTSSGPKPMRGLYNNAINITLNKGEIPNPDGTITATLDGKFSLQFDVESKAQNHQVNIQSIDVQIVHDPPPDLTDINQNVHGLGGGAIPEFEIPLSATKNIPIGGSVIAHAQLLMNDQAVDYIYLKPGERETIRILGNLPGPGRYKVTPIINYALEAKNSSQETGTSVIYYPENYRYWDSIYNETSQTNTSVPIGNIILNTRNLTFKYATPVSYSKQACLNISKWIAFVARLSSDDQRLFVIQSTSGEMLMLSHMGAIPNILGWDNSGSLYFREDLNDNETKQTISDYKVWNLTAGLISIEKAQIPSIDFLAIQSGLEPGLTQDPGKDKILGRSSDGQWYLTGGDDLSIMNQNGSCNQVLLQGFYKEQNNSGGDSTFIDANIQQ